MRSGNSALRNWSYQLNNEVEIIGPAYPDIEYAETNESGLSFTLIKLTLIV